MAQRKVKMLDCDRCGSTKDVERRRLMRVDPDRQFTFDACAECAGSVPLAEWEAQMPRGPRRTANVVVSGAVVAEAGKKRTTRRR